METVDDFLLLLDEELGLPLTPDELGAGFDTLPSWDSVQLLALLSLLERRTGRSVPLPEVLAARSLAEIYALVAVP